MVDSSGRRVVVGGAAGSSRKRRARLGTPGGLFVGSCRLDLIERHGHDTRRTAIQQHAHMHMVCMVLRRRAPVRVKFVDDMGETVVT